MGVEKMKIGIPKGLMYYNYFPLWQNFFQILGHEVVVSGSTNSEILEKGIDMAVEDVCLPVKLYLGHAVELIDNSDVDVVFSPRYVSVEPKRYLCPKVFGAPDIITANRQEDRDKVKEITINYRKNKLFHYREIVKLGRKLGNGIVETINAYRNALKVQEDYDNKLLKGYLPIELLEGEHISDEKNSQENGLKISVLGHSYNVNDHFLNMNLLKKLSSSGAEIFTYEMVENQTKDNYLSQLQEKRPYWSFGEDLLGAVSHHIHEKDVDGVIIVVAFGCGPDSLIGELCERIIRKYDIPVLYLTMEEHSGDIGNNTRVEAFLDMLERRRLAQ